MRGLIYLFGILCFIYYTYSKPNGAPSDSCFYMTPRHIHPHTFRRVFPTKAMGLYNITTSADVFRPDRPIRVTLWGPPFKGFMMVAAEEGAKDWPTGIFYSEDGAAKRLSCLARGDTVTHQNNSYKDSVSVLWYGPENMMSEQIQFIATVVVNLTIYYTNIRSGMIRLDPSLHGTTLDPEAAGTGGEGGGPVVVTMDPWLSGQSATQAPTNWWSNLAGGRRNTGLGNTGWGAGAAGGAGTYNQWGANTGGSLGANTGGSGGWGSQTGTGGSGGWGAQTGTGGSGGWGSQSGTGGTGTGSWGYQGGTSGQGTGTGGSANNQWGASQGGWGSNTGQQSWGQNSGAGAAGTGTGTGGNTWGANGDWQQINQGSVTSSNWNAGQTSWHAPGDGRPIWNWNSGKIETTAAPATTQAPKKQTTPASAWSAQALLELVQRLGFGPVARAP